MYYFVFDLGGISEGQGTNMGNRIVGIFFTSFVFLFCACNMERGGTVISDRQQRPDSISKILSGYNAEGKYDSLIVLARGFLAEAEKEKDTLTILYSGVYIAQAYLFLGDADSVKYYLDLIAPFPEEMIDLRLRITLNNVMGINAVKSDLNYSRALEYFQKGYEWAKKEEFSKSINHRITLLINIVNIFYIRSDKHGMEYAEEAYKLIREENINDYYKCAAILGMAQMTFLAGHYDKALGFVRQADRIASDNNYNSFLPLISLLYADIYDQFGDHRRAESNYLRALEAADLTDPGTVSFIYLHYGKFCEDRHRYERAISLYKQGLDISEKNIEFRRNLLMRLSDLYYLAGDRETSLDYYREYRTHLEEVENTRREQEFNNQLLTYRQVAHEHEIQTKELEVLEANRRVMIFVFILSIFLVISGSLMWLYNRQGKMYRTLVAQHQNFTQRLSRVGLAEEESGADQSDKTDGNRELFLRVEKLMREDKFYRRKDISLDKVAENLSSNKSYISKAINTFVGISFNSYINMYRIQEATSIISDPRNEIPLKKIADDLGYNSVSVFYKAFQRETGCTPGRYRKEIEENQN